MDASVSPEVIGFTKSIAAAVEGVAGIEKCRIRKSGLHLSMDIHVMVDGDLSVRRSHAIAHQVKDRLLASQHHINDVTVHIEPSRVSPVDRRVQTKSAAGFLRSTAHGSKCVQHLGMQGKCCDPSEPRFSRFRVRCSASGFFHREHHCY